MFRPNSFRAIYMHSTKEVHPQKITISTNHTCRAKQGKQIIVYSMTQLPLTRMPNIYRNVSNYTAIMTMIIVGS